ncbi:MAG TPA: xylulokinase [Lacipirellulaceae bacterium]|nr:xylulokinase [Lacipirellulaceae bacterium]
MGICLGIDVGTSGVKCLAVAPDGRVLAQTSSNYPCSHPRPLWSEQDPEHWWQATIKAVRAVVKAAKLRAADVAAIGLSGQMHGSVFLDRRGQVIRPAILWNDQRTAAECEEIERRAGGRKRLIEMVANPALTGFTAPKILWLRNHEPKHFERTAKVLLPKDEVRRRLTGEFATEVSDASGTLLLDVVKRRWSKPLLAKLELDADLLPTCVESEEVTGTLTPEAAKLLGLTTNCCVVGGAGDCAAGAVGNGIVKAGLLNTSIGTSGVVFVHSDRPQFDPQGRLHTFCHAVRGKWHMMGVILSAGGSLQWFQDAFYSVAARGGGRKATVPFEELVREAAATPVGAEGLYFLPYLAGERTPHLDPHARGAWVGLTLAHSRGHVVRSILEGVTFALRDSLALIEGLGVPVRQIRASGGGSKNPFWRQMQADVFGKAVSAMVADEGAAYGAALLATVGAGHFADIAEACTATVRTADGVKPDARARKEYDRRFPVFQGLYAALRPQFPLLA